MPVPIKIAVHGVARADELISSIREKAVVLESCHPALGALSVALEDRPAHKYARKQFNARLELRVHSGLDLVINREHHADPDVALRDAFKEADRQLAELERARRVGRPQIAHIFIDADSLKKTAT